MHVVRAKLSVIIVNTYILFVRDWSLQEPNYVYIMRCLLFSQPCRIGYPFSGMWRYAVEGLFPDVLVYRDVLVLK